MSAVVTVARRLSDASFFAAVSLSWGCVLAVATVAGRLRALERVSLIFFLSANLPLSSPDRQRRVDHVHLRLGPALAAVRDERGRSRGGRPGNKCGCSADELQQSFEIAPHLIQVLSFESPSLPSTQYTVAQ